MRINVSQRRRSRVTVPDVIGQPFDQASTALQGQGFAVSRIDVDSDQPKGTVVAQSPQRHARRTGSTITLTRLEGPEARRPSRT